MIATKNIGFIDLLIRAILIADLIALPLMGYVPTAVSYVFSPIAGLLAINCFTSHCWLYQRLNLSTRQD